MAEEVKKEEVTDEKPKKEPAIMIQAVSGGIKATWKDIKTRMFALAMLEEAKYSIIRYYDEKEAREAFEKMEEAEQKEFLRQQSAGGKNFIPNLMKEKKIIH